MVDPTALERVAIQAASELAAGALKPPSATRKPSLQALLLERNPLGRYVLFSQAEKAIRKAAGGHYPAPPAILEAVKAGLEGGMRAGLDTEARLFGQLGFTPQSAALRGLFFAQTASKKNPYRAEESEGGGAPNVRTVGVLGAGLMGSGIAQVTSGAGLQVVLKDRDAPSIARGVGQIEASLAARVKRRALTTFERDLQLSRIAAVSDSESDPVWTRHMARCDLVVEAVPEVMSVKHAVLRQVEPLLRPGAVFATNTSALPIAQVASAAARPASVLGMHYFSPVDKVRAIGCMRSRLHRRWPLCCRSHLRPRLLFFGVGMFFFGHTPVLRCLFTSSTPADASAGDHPSRGNLPRGAGRRLRSGAEAGCVRACVRALPRLSRDAEHSLGRYPHSRILLTLHPPASPDMYHTPPQTTPTTAPPPPPPPPSPTAGKTVIVVKDTPGFYVNKSLGPWAAEALLLVQRGMDPLALDVAVRAFGYPVGPVSLADEVGVDVLMHTTNTLTAALGSPRMDGADPAWLQAMVQAKMLGRKTGRGFFEYPEEGGGKTGSGKQSGGGGDPLTRVKALVFGAKKGGAKPINPEAMALLAPYRSAEDAGIKPVDAVDRMLLRFIKGEATRRRAASHPAAGPGTLCSTGFRADLFPPCRSFPLRLQSASIPWRRGSSAGPAMAIWAQYSGSASRPSWAGRSGTLILPAPGPWLTVCDAWLTARARGSSPRRCL